VEQIRETLPSPILVTPAFAGMTSFIIRGGQIAMTVRSEVRFRRLEELTFEVTQGGLKD
jgi:hypothetical protein